MFREQPIDTIDCLIDVLIDVCPDLGSRAEALGRSGLAFAHYGFSPDQNYNFLKVHPGKTWLYETTDHDGYGVFESLGAHSGYDFRHYSGLRVMDLWALAEVELEAGRHLLVVPSPATPRVGEIVAVEKHGSDRTWVVKRGDELDRMTVAFSIEVAKSPAPIPAVLTIRDRPTMMSEAGRGGLERDVILWAVRHGRAATELLYTHECYLAPGLNAYRALDELLARLEPGDGAAHAYVRRHLGTLRHRRRAASKYLEGLATRLDAGLSASLQADPLRVAAGHYERHAIALEECLAERGPLRPDTRSLIGIEEDALQAMERSLV